MVACGKSLLLDPRDSEKRSQLSPTGVVVLLMRKRKRPRDFSAVLIGELHVVTLRASVAVSASDNFVDQSIFHGFGCGHESIAISVGFNFVERLTRVVNQNLIQTFFYVFEFFGVNHDVFRRTLHSGKGLVDHDPCVWQSVSFACSPCRQQYGSHRSGLAHAVSRNVARNELHRIVDRHARTHAAAG